MKNIATVDELYEELVDHIISGCGKFPVLVEDSTGKLFKIKELIFEGNNIIITCE